MDENKVAAKEDEDDFEVIEETEEAAEEASKEEAKAEEAKPEPDKKEESDKKSDDDLSGISESVKKRIDKLTFKMREAERREQAAIEYARSLQVENQTFKQKAQQLDQSFVQEYENRLTAQQQLVIDKLKAAVESGDVEGQVEAQKQLSKLAVDSERLRISKESRVAQEHPAAQPQPQPAPQQQPQRVRPDPRAEAWAERNEWFGQDQAMTATAFVIHSQLVEEEGYDPTSDEYYSELDNRIRRDFPHKFKKAESPARPAPAAVASARPTARSDSNPKQIKLTRSQIEIARKLGVSVKDYARQLQRLDR